MQKKAGRKVGYKLRLRDAVLALIVELRRIAALHVYTMGSVSYSGKVLGIIDPRNAFGGRVLCRHDGDEIPFEKSLYHFEAETDALAQERRAHMIILDDRESAWCARSRPHVLQCAPFRCWREDGLLLLPNAWPDQVLFDMLRVVRAIVQELRRRAAHSVPAALCLRRQAVFHGVVVVFSGGLLRDATQPQRCSPWRIAEAFGARCKLHFDSHTVTHVVSGQLGTSSVRKALGLPNIHAVSVGWLTDSAERWERQSEVLYQLQSAAAKILPGTSRCSAEAQTRLPQEGQAMLSRHGHRRHSPVGSEEWRADGRLLASRTLPSLDDEAKVSGPEGGITLLLPAACKTGILAALPIISASQGQGPAATLTAAILYSAPCAKKKSTRVLLEAFGRSNLSSEFVAERTLLLALSDIVGRDALLFILTAARTPAWAGPTAP